MTDIVDRLTHEIDYAQGILIENALCAMEDARDEIVRLRALITEWASAELDNDFTHNDTAATRYVRAMDALREEANR